MTNDKLLPINELFVSIQGEGPRSGYVTSFIRLQGCPLACSFCDTRYAQCPPDKNPSGMKWMPLGDVIEWVEEQDVLDVCLTGGEPLWKDYGWNLLTALSERTEHTVSVETNGAIDLERARSDRYDTLGGTFWVMDYKLPGSGMEKFMLACNLRHILFINGTMKFVCTNREDVARALQVIDKVEKTLEVSSAFHSAGLPTFLFHAVPGFEKELAETLIKLHRADLRFGIQLHKVLWGNKRGI